MPLLYDRIIRVTVAGLVITEPRITVNLDRQIDPTQDRGDVTIYNLKPDHSDRIHDRGGPVVVEAGYPQTVATLFRGSVQRVIRERGDLAHLTKINLGDMVHAAERLGGGEYQISWEARTSVRRIVDHIIVNGLKLSPGPLDSIPVDAVFPYEFYSTIGGAVTALESALRPLGLTWYEEDGVVRINEHGAAQSDAPTIKLTPKTGLIGRPVVTDEGAELRTFLNARITLGCVLEVESETVGGRWKVTGLRHSADNWSGPFESFVDLRAL